MNVRCGGLFEPSFRGVQVDLAYGKNSVPFLLWGEV
jgi:hypothetical protein